jgi:Histidine phosphatase superfamily (branch 1)
VINPADIEVVGVAWALRRLATVERERHACSLGPPRGERSQPQPPVFVPAPRPGSHYCRASAGRTVGGCACRATRELSRPPALFASPLRRAQQTAEIVAGRLGGDVKTLDDLREVNVGDLDGRSDPEAWEIYESVLDDWRRGDHDRRFPGGEDRH